MLIKSPPFSSILNPFNPWPPWPPTHTSAWPSSLWSCHSSGPVQGRNTNPSNDRIFKPTFQQPTKFGESQWHGVTHQLTKSVNLTFDWNSPVPMRGHQNACSVPLLRYLSICNGSNVAIALNERITSMKLAWHDWPGSLGELCNLLLCHFHLFLTWINTKHSAKATHWTQWVA